MISWLTECLFADDDALLDLVLRLQCMHIYQQVSKNFGLTVSYL